jgi:hypothetical protein
MTDQLPDLLGETVRVGKLAAADGLRGARIPARRATDAEVDAARVQRLQHAEGLGGTEGAVVGQEHAAAADADASRLGAESCEEHFGTRVGERGDRVVLGQPIAVIAELVGAAGERQRFLDRAARAEAVDDR